uniref:Uncharacterized protein n=1 Tax=Arundo donax TaxID=35708 RepID=A0A0A9HJF7_ARUDO
MGQQILKKIKNHVRRSCVNITNISGMRKNKNYLFVRRLFRFYWI